MWLCSDYYFGERSNDNIGIVVVDKCSGHADELTAIIAAARTDPESMPREIEKFVVRVQPNLSGVLVVAIRDAFDLFNGGWLVKCVHPSFDMVQSCAEIKRYVLVDDVMESKCP